MVREEEKWRIERIARTNRITIKRIENQVDTYKFSIVDKHGDKYLIDILNVTATKL